MIVAKIVSFGADGRQVYTWCPGCDALHPFTIESKGRLNSGVTWDWDGSLDAPTFSPSLLIHTAVHLCKGEHTLTECDGECGAIGHAVLYRVDGVLRQFRTFEVPEGAEEVRGHVSPCPREQPWGACHSFLRNGLWEFLSDSAHALAGQRDVPMVALPEGDDY